MANKKFTALVAAFAVATAFAGCAPADMNIGDVRGDVGPIEGYHVTEGWCENGIIVTPEGHKWDAEGFGDYRGYVKVSYDDRGDADIGNDIPIMAIPIDEG